MKVTRIRAHHLLCLQGFKGLWYNSAFTENMRRIKEKAEKENPEIRIVKIPDAICEFCPKRNGNLCENEKKESEIKAMDEKVMECAGFEEGNTIKILSAFEKADKSVNFQKALEICSSCSWQEDCLWFQKKKNEKQD